jgi:hypothetical protein
MQQPHFFQPKSQPAFSTFLGSLEFWLPFGQAKGKIKKRDASASFGYSLSHLIPFFCHSGR